MPIDPLTLTAIMGGVGAGASALRPMGRPLAFQVRDQFQQMQQGGAVPGLDALSAQAKQATDPSFLNSIFNTIGGNLMQRGAQASGRASQAAAAQAASRGLANPSAFIGAMGNQAATPFQEAAGNAEVARAQALQQNALKAFDMQYLINRAAQGDREAADRIRIALEQLALQRQQIEPSILDWLGIGLGVATQPGIGGLFGGGPGRVSAATATPPAFLTR